MGAEVTTLLTDFKVITPEIVAQSTSKAKRKKAASLEPSHIEQKTDAPPAKKKAKKAPMKPQNTLDNQLPPPITFQTILRVEKPPPPVAGKAKASAKPTYLEMEPFQFTITGTFAEFLDNIAKTLPCPRNNLVTQGMQWKMEKPKNADPHPLNSEVGFKSIIDKVSAAQNKDRTIILFIKPPAKPVPDERVSPSLSY